MDLYVVLGVIAGARLRAQVLRREHPVSLGIPAEVKHLLPRGCRCPISALPRVMLWQVVVGLSLDELLLAHVHV